MNGTDTRSVCIVRKSKFEIVSKKYVNKQRMLIVVILQKSPALRDYSDTCPVVKISPRLGIASARREDFPALRDCLCLSGKFPRAPGLPPCPVGKFFTALGDCPCLRREDFHAHIAPALSEKIFPRSVIASTGKNLLAHVDPALSFS